jgi:hypothetical protein
MKPEWSSISASDIHPLLRRQSGDSPAKATSIRIPQNALDNLRECLKGDRLWKKSETIDEKPFSHFKISAKRH